MSEAPGHFLKDYFSNQLSDREKSVLPVVVVLLVVAAVLRTQPHIANVTPFFAISILVGFLLGPNRVVLAGVLSAVAMLAGDLVIGLHWTMIFVYAGMAIATIFGALGSNSIITQRSWVRRIVATFTVTGLASTSFFIVSNLGVWLVGALYPRTIEGLITCFTLAIPFFTNSLTADLFFGTVFITVALRILNQTAATPETETSLVKQVHGR